MQTDYSRQYVSLWQNHWWWQARHELVMHSIRLLRKQVGATDKQWRMLDIGCGGGVAFRDLSTFGDCYGLEPDPVLATAIPEYSSVIQQQPFDENYQPDEPFDLVLMLDVLEHIERDEDALLHLKKVLKEDAFAIITVPALESLWSAHDVVNKHFRRYTAGNLRTLLNSTGYHVQRLHYYFTWSLPLMYVRKLLARKEDHYSVTVPGWPVNGMFRTFSNFENLLRRFHVPMPIGSSLLAIVKNIRKG